MKIYALALAAAAVVASPAFADDIQLGRKQLGSGTPGTTGTETASSVGPGSDYYHAPQYMPGYPTAATIWPRAISVDCAGTTCDGYRWSPKYGRGEYLFVVPSQRVAAAPVVTEKVVTVEKPVVVIKEVIKEVEVKKKGQ